MLDLNRDRDYGAGAARRRLGERQRRESDLRRMDDLASHLPPPPPPKRVSPPRHRADQHVKWGSAPANGSGSPLPPHQQPAFGRRAGSVSNVSPPREGRRASVQFASPPQPHVAQTYPPPPPSYSDISPIGALHGGDGASPATHHSSAASPGMQRPRSFLAELLATRDALADEAQRRRAAAGAPPAEWSAGARVPSVPLHHYSSPPPHHYRDAGNDDDVGPLDFDSFSLGDNRKMERLETPADIRVARRRRAEARAAAGVPPPPSGPPPNPLYRPFNPAAAARGYGDQAVGDGGPPSYLHEAVAGAGSGVGAARRHQLDELPEVASKLGSAVARDEVDRLLHKFATVSPRGAKFDFDAGDVRQAAPSSSVGGSHVAVVSDSDGALVPLPGPPPGSRQRARRQREYGPAPPGSPPAILEVTSMQVVAAASPPTTARKNDAAANDGVQRGTGAAPDADKPEAPGAGGSVPPTPPVASTPAPVDNTDDAAMLEGSS